MHHHSAERGLFPNKNISKSQITIYLISFIKNKFSEFAISKITKIKLYFFLYGWSKSSQNVFTRFTRPPGLITKQTVLHWNVKYMFKSRFYIQLVNCSLALSGKTMTCTWMFYGPMSISTGFYLTHMNAKNIMRTV